MILLRLSLFFNFSPMFPQLKLSGWAVCCARGKHFGGAGWAQPPCNWDSVALPISSDSLSSFPKPWVERWCLLQISGCDKLLQHKKQEGTVMQMLQGHAWKKTTPVSRNSNYFVLTSITLFDYIHWIIHKGRLCGEVWPTCDTYINIYMYMFIHILGINFNESFITTSWCCLKQITLIMRVNFQHKTK